VENEASLSIGDLDGSTEPPGAPGPSSDLGFSERPPLLASIPPMVVAVERAVLDPFGTLEVSGWAVSLAPIVAVQVYADDMPVGVAIHGLASDDIASLHDVYPYANRSGYYFSVKLRQSAPSPAVVRVEATALGNLSRDASAEVLIAAESTSPSPGAGPQKTNNSSIRLQVDEVVLTTDGSLMIEGWAFAKSAIEDIQVVLGASEIGHAEIGLSRLDVGQHFSGMPGAGQAGFGFRKELDATFEGEHLVILTITCTDGETCRIDLPVRAIAMPAWGPAVAAPADDSSLKLFIDRPELSGDRAQRIVQGGLMIEGWALARDGVASVEVLLDGHHLDTARYGERREDIAAAFPDWDNALLCGFGLAVPPRALTNGQHTIRAELHTLNGLSTAREFHIEVDQRLGPNGPWALRRKMPATEISVTEHVLSGLKWRPRFGIVLGIDDLEKSNQSSFLTLSSLRDQVYRDWHVVVAVRGAKPRMPISALLSDDFADIAAQITFAFDALDDSITDLIARMPGERPDLIAMASAGDILGCDALLELAVASGLHPEADLFYGDERRINPDSGRVEAFFKPEWSPDLLLGTNYIGRSWCAEPALIERTGATVKEWLRCGEYDLVLRATETARGIHRLPKVIAERARGHFDHPAQERRALERAMLRRGIEGRIADGCAPGYYRVQRRVSTKGLVSIIIPTCASRGLIRTCIETLRSITAYRNFEIICIENIPSRQRRWKRWLRLNADKVVETTEKFNWSRFNNLAAQAASGEFLLFLNDDVEIIEPGWLDALLEYAEQPEIGVVGARLLYPDRKIQHAGIFWVPGGGRHAFRFSAEDNLGYFGLALTPRNVVAVTGACLLVRRREFDALGGFDERHDVINNDVDFCLRARARGRRIVYTPFATLIHHELASRSAIADDFDATAFDERWADQLAAGDPFYHPSLTRERDDFAPNTEPLELIYAGYPLIAGEEVRRVLAVKLDHIGDFITAIPALRRLRHHFPSARLTVLGPPSISSFAPLLPEIDEVINFEFFHTRSGLGQKSLSIEDLVGLQQRLAPYRFDLAIDLRKSPDTRPILRYTGARWLAGFDRDNWFPWLDIALEWEGDHKVHRKRSHVGDDLIRLVDAVSGATQPDRDVLPRVSFATLEGPAQRRRLVCIHPGVGATSRQWPVEHYAALIDLLVAGHRVLVAVIGGPDEAEIADRVIERVHHREAVQSFVGKVKLSELPALLASSALYVGNNSGPKHIAAGLGVPTIGIHSGAVDAREWGPIGRKALAVRRDMHCSPCYLARAEDCPYGLACLTELRPPEVYEICSRLLAIDPAVQ
jgi:ADP-heptose:LPS heptosyltransferase/GT2 family glycosyltransferase